MVLINLIAFMFNLSNRNSKSPAKFKRADVVAIFKEKGNMADPANYRPISAAPFLAKLFEKCILSVLFPETPNTFPIMNTVAPLY